MELLQDNPNELLTRDQLSRRLKERGFPVASKTLATAATRGGGPPYRKFGRCALYPWGSSLDWAVKRLTKLVSSSSELDAATGLSSRVNKSKEPTV